MKIRPDCPASTEDFWYDLSSGGYLKPSEILEDLEDIKRVMEAIEVLREFEKSCEEQIDGFIQ